MTDGSTRAAPQLRTLILATGLAMGAPMPVAAQAVSREEVAHVLRRITFGPTPAQLASITTEPQLTAYIRDQLQAPSTGYSPSTQALFTGPTTLFPAPPSFPNHLMAGAVKVGWSLDDLQDQQMVLALMDDYQLRELMTLFWEIHFSTQLAKVQVGFPDSLNYDKHQVAILHEWNENAGFRERALGTFADLLAWSMNSPAMRYYLDASTSCATAGRSLNQNYAREVVELHTLGPADSGQLNYTNDGDIPEITRILSGLYVNASTGVSYYEAACHDFGPKSVFLTTPVPDFVSPLNIPMSQEVEAFRAHLVAAPQTKRFVCGKLIHFFVGDHADPNPTLLNACVAAWGASGDIEAILGVIFASPQFRNLGAQTPMWARVKLPLEGAIAQARMLGGSIAAPTTLAQLHQRFAAIRKLLDAMGALPFTFPSPDGYPLESQGQIGTASVWNTGEYAYRLFSDARGITLPAENLVYNPLPVIQAEVARLGLDFQNQLHVVDAALGLFFHTRVSDTDRAQALMILDKTPAGAAVPWSPTAPDADLRIRLLVAFVNTIAQSFEK